MKNCINCPYFTSRKTKYGIYDWCKKYASAVSSPMSPCKDVDR